MESPITILWNVSKPRPDDREAVRAGSAIQSQKTVTDVCLQMQEQIQIQSQFHIQKYNWKCKAQECGQVPPWRQKRGSATPPGKLTPQATGNGPIHPNSMLPSIMPSSWVDASENTEASAETNTENTMPLLTSIFSCPKTCHLHGMQFFSQQQHQIDEHKNEMSLLVHKLHHRLNIDISATSSTKTMSAENWPLFTRNGCGVVLSHKVLIWGIKGTAPQ